MVFSISFCWHSHHTFFWRFRPTASNWHHEIFLRVSKNFLQLFIRILYTRVRFQVSLSSSSSSFVLTWRRHPGYSLPLAKFSFLPVFLNFGFGRFVFLLHWCSIVFPSEVKSCHASPLSRWHTHIIHPNWVLLYVEQYSIASTTIIHWD